MGPFFRCSSAFPRASSLAINPAALQALLSHAVPRCLAHQPSALCPPSASATRTKTQTPTQTKSERRAELHRVCSSATSMASIVAKESAANNPGLVEEPDPATKDYVMQQTMYRIKDPKESLRFYSQVLGMRLLKRLDFPGASFTVYFMGYEDPANIPSDPGENLKWFCKTKGAIELTHNWGTESDPEFKGYHTGNTEPRGWGHVGVMVDDVYKACERFERLGVEFVKKPDEGRMKGLAFIKDPDGYWIEILAYPQMGSILDAAQ